MMEFYDVNNFTKYLSHYDHNIVQQEYFQNIRMMKHNCYNNHDSTDIQVGGSPQLYYHRNWHDCLILLCT